MIFILLYYKHGCQSNDKKSANHKLSLRRKKMSSSWVNYLYYEIINFYTHNMCAHHSMENNGIILSYQY